MDESSQYHFLNCGQRRQGHNQTLWVKPRSPHFKYWTWRCWAPGRPAPWCRSARGWTETVTAESVPEIHAGWAKTSEWEDLVQRMMELFSARDSYHESIRHLCGLQKHLIQNTCSAWRMAWSPPGGQEERPPSLQVHPLAPIWMKIQTGLFPGALLPCPALLFSHFCGGFYWSIWFLQIL